MRGMHGSSIHEPENNINTKTNLAQTLRYLWPYLWDFKGRVILAMLALLAAKAASLLLPWALKHIIDGVDRNLQPELILPLAFILFYGLLRFGSVFFGDLRDALFS